MKLSVNFFSHRHFWIGMYGVGVEAECSVCSGGVCGGRGYVRAKANRLLLETKRDQ